MFVHRLLKIKQGGQAGTKSKADCLALSACLVWISSQRSILFGAREWRETESKVCYCNTGVPIMLWSMNQTRDLHVKNFSCYHSFLCWIALWRRLTFSLLFCRYFAREVSSFLGYRPYLINKFRCRRVRRGNLHVHGFWTDIQNFIPSLSVSDFSQSPDPFFSHSSLSDAFADWYCSPMSFYLSIFHLAQSNLQMKNLHGKTRSTKVVPINSTTQFCPSYRKESTRANANADVCRAQGIFCSFPADTRWCSLCACASCAVVTAHDSPSFSLQTEAPSAL